MPARLFLTDADEPNLALKLGGDSEEFQAQLARAKTVPGRRFNGEAKLWEFPNTAESLLRLVHTVEPELSADLQARVQEATAEQEEELVTRLPDDAALGVPWASRLAPAQRAGIDFMAEHPHAILADDMGSGKTVQALSTVWEYHIRQGWAADKPLTNLIITENSVRGHWKREIKKWVGTDAAVIIDGATPEKREAQVREGIEAGVEWFIVNWEKLQTRVKLVGTAKSPGVLDSIEWDAVIADEVHKAKNRKSQQAKGLHRLTAPVQIGATGTPVMNNPGELFPLLRWLDSKTFTSYWQFFHTYTEFYEGYKGKPVVIGVKNADGLRFVLADKMVRRSKREIHPDMKKPFDPIVYEPEMTKDQQKLYDEVTKQFWVELVQDFSAEWEPEKKEQFVELVEEDKLDLNQIKLMVPGAAVRTLRQRQVATSPAVLEVEGHSPPDSSGKLDDVIRVVKEGGERPWVLFTWFRASAELVAKRLAPLGEAHTFTGDTPAEDRTELAASFQAGEFPFIVCTLKAGGTGIDLYRASDCAFVEEDWTPAINDQAFGRIDRKGQQQRPQKHSFRTKDSVDTGNIAPKNAVKRLITETIMGGS